MMQHHEEPDRKAQVSRLRRVIGQLKAIERMIEEEHDCVEVLTQLLASKKAIQSLSEKILEEHLVHCVDNADQGNGRKMMRELVTVLRRFVK